VWYYSLQVFVPLGLALLGLVVGQILERRHYRDIVRREAQSEHVPVTTESKLWDSTRGVAETRMVTGVVVVSVDHFKRFLAWLRGLFGGEVIVYSSLIDRGRREAILRLREEFPSADIFLNLRFTTSTIASGSGRMGTVEVMATATGVRYSTSLRPPIVPNASHDE